MTHPSSFSTEAPLGPYRAFPMTHPSPLEASTPPSPPTCSGHSTECGFPPPPIEQSVLHLLFQELVAFDGQGDQVFDSKLKVMARLEIVRRQYTEVWNKAAYRRPPAVVRREGVRLAALALMFAESLPEEGAMLE